MTTPGIRAVLVIATVCGACSFGDSMEAYCERTGSCACTGDNCCMKAGVACSDAYRCCEGFVCADGTCQDKPGAFLAIDPPEATLVAPPLGTTGPTQTLTVSNLGLAPTAPLGFTPVAFAGFRIDVSECEGVSLAPGESCQLEVAAAPERLGPTVLVLTATAGVHNATSTVRYQRGHWVSIERAGSGETTVISAPPGISCPSACGTYFDQDTPLTLTATTPAGSTFLGFTGAPCAVPGPTCSFTLDGAVSLTVHTETWLHVEVIRRPGSTSSVTVDGNTCEGACDFPLHGALRLEALPQLGEGDGVTWEGPCASNDRGTWCPLNVAGRTEVRAVFAPANRVFVTEPVFLPAFAAGPATADQSCQLAASQRGLQGSFRAWLETDAPDAGVAQRFGAARGWVRLPDLFPFADELESLREGEIFYPLVDHAGMERVMTGGVTPGGSDCEDWTGPGTVQVGRPGAGGRSWVAAPGETASCEDATGLYCFQVDHARGVGPENRPLRRAFVSSPWRPGGAVSAADAHCQAEAVAHGLGGTFRAQLAAAGASGLARVPEMGRTRLDGVFLSADGERPLNVTADGGYLPGDGEVPRVWSGAPDANCLEWTTEAGTALYGRADLGGHRFDAGVSPCDAALRLYCVQD